MLLSEIVGIMVLPELANFKIYSDNKNILGLLADFVVGATFSFYYGSYSNKCSVEEGKKLLNKSS